MTEYGIQWQEFSRKDGRLVSKEKIFKTQKARDKFADKLTMTNDNLYQILSYLN